MGFSICWLAIRGKEPDVVAADLGLVRTARKAQFGEAPVTGRMMAGGWFVLVFDRAEHPVMQDASVSALSRGAQVVACSVEEHVMCSSAAFWNDGVQVWKLCHDAQEDLEHLLESGRLPGEYPSVKRTLQAEQAAAGGRDSDTDYIFDIPLATAKEIVGFKHDESTGPRGPDFDVYAAQSAGRKRWWHVWSG